MRLTGGGAIKGEMNYYNDLLRIVNVADVF